MSKHLAVTHPCAEMSSKGSSEDLRSQICELEAEPLPLSLWQILRPPPLGAAKWCRHGPAQLTIISAGGSSGPWCHALTKVKHETWMSTKNWHFMAASVSDLKFQDISGLHHGSNLLLIRIRDALSLRNPAHAGYKLLGRANLCRGSYWLVLECLGCLASSIICNRGDAAMINHDLTLNYESLWINLINHGIMELIMEVMNNLHII